MVRHASYVDWYHGGLDSFPDMNPLFWINNVNVNLFDHAKGTRYPAVHIKPARPERRREREQSCFIGRKERGGVDAFQVLYSHLAPSYFNNWSSIFQLIWIIWTLFIPVV